MMCTICTSMVKEYKDYGEKSMQLGKHNSSREDYLEKDK